MQLLRDTFETQRHRQVKSQGMEKETPCKNSNQKEAWLPISDKIHFYKQKPKGNLATFINIRQN